MFQKVEDCDLQFALNTFKYGLPKDNSCIYNSLTRVLPQTFDELLSKINKFARVEDDELVVGDGEKQGNNNKNGGNGNAGKFGKLKRKRKEDLSEVSEERYKGVHTIVMKLIH